MTAIPVDLQVGATTPVTIPVEMQIGGGDPVAMPIELDVTVHPAPAVIAPPLPSDFGPVLQSTLGDAMRNGRAYALPTPPEPIRIETTVDLSLTGSAVGGIFCGTGARIVSAVAGGAPVIRLEATGAGAVEGFTWRDLLIEGSGAEGEAILFTRPYVGNCIRQFELHNVRAMRCKGIARFYGNVFEARVYNIKGRENRDSDLVLENPPAGQGDGVISTIDVIGGTFQDSGKHGAEMRGWARGLTLRSVHFMNCKDWGLFAPNGLEWAESCTAENCSDAVTWLNPDGTTRTSKRAGFRIDNYCGGLVNCRFHTVRRQVYAIESFVTGEMHVGPISVGGTPTLPAPENYVRAMYLRKSGDASARPVVRVQGRCGGRDIEQPANQGLDLYRM